LTSTISAHPNCDSDEACGFICNNGGGIHSRQDESNARAHAFPNSDGFSNFVSLHGDRCLLNKSIQARQVGHGAVSFATNNAANSAVAASSTAGAAGGEQQLAQMCKNCGSGELVVSFVSSSFHAFFT
jgi:hypothetical protein